MSRCKAAVTGLLMMLVLSAARAADSGIGIYVDQDLFIPMVNQDRDYTMGFAMEFFQQDYGIYPLDQGLRWVAEALGVHGHNDQIRRSYMVGSVDYTPDNLGESAPIPNDRPYASVLFLSNKRVRAAGGQVVGVEAQFGVLGTYVAREVQRTLHGWWRSAANSTTPVDPKGWHNQISAGGEPTMRLRITRGVRWAQHPGLWDLAGTWGINIGYQTNATAGVAARIGQIASPFWSLPYNPINRGNFVPSLGGPEWYLWATYHARLVGYDALLQGQFRDSAVTYHSNQLQRLIHEGGAGLTFAWRAVQVTTAANFRTSELKQGLDNRTQWWGGTYLTVRF